MTITIDTLWSRIESQQGETFTQIRGGEFTYAVSGSTLTLDRTNRTVSKGQFEQALAMVPLPNTTVVQHLQAPSYIYAVIMDERIRRDDW